MIWNKRSRTDFISGSLRRMGLLVMLCAQTATSQAQENSSPQRGVTPTGSYLLSDIEILNNVNGNLMFHIPLGTLPTGRGGQPGTSLPLVYNSKLWDTYPGVYFDPISQQNFNTTLLRLAHGAWSYGSRYTLRLINRLDDQWVACPALGAYYIWKLIMIFPDGSQHEFRPTGYSDNGGYFTIRPDGWETTCFGSGGTNPSVTTTMTYYSTDATYLRLDFAHDSDDQWSNNPWTLYLPDGGRVTGGGTGTQTIYDRNNNSITIQNITLPNGNLATRITDQLNRSITVEYRAGFNTDTVTLAGFNNETLQWNVKWKGINVYKNYYAHSDPRVPVQLLNQGITVVDEIQLPGQAGGLKYRFDYNPGTGTPSYGWGEASLIVLPSLAQATYTYASDGNNNLFPPTVLVNRPTRKDLTYSLEYDGTSTPTTETWLYSVVTTGVTQTTAPDGGVTKHYFSPYLPVPTWFNGLVHKTELPDGRVVEQLWQPNRPFGESDCNPYVKTEFTSIRNSGGGLVKTAIKDFNYSKNGNLTRLYEYDWVDYASVPRDGDGRPIGVPVGAPLKRSTISAYNSSTPEAPDTTTDSPNAYHKSTALAVRNAIASREIQSASQTIARTEFTYDNPDTTANLVLERSWDSTKGGVTYPLSISNSVSVSHQYDAYGSRLLTIDPGGIQTQFTYGPVNGYTGLYVTEIRTAAGTSVQRTTQHSYDFGTGLLTFSRDTDNNLITLRSYDPLGRPTLVQEAYGTAQEKWTETAYFDVDRRVIVRSDLISTGDRKLASIQHFDPLGRLRLSRTLEDSNTQSPYDESAGIKVQTRYQYSGTYRYQVVSNPYRASTSAGAGSETTMGWTRSQSDQGGRLLAVQTFSGATLPAPWGANSASTGTVTSSYDANAITVTDQALKARRSLSDALGRLVQVVEDPNGLAYTTTYTYDGLSNLLQVGQGGQSRSFNYSSLSRLLSSTQPESGTTTYGYDNNGNLLQKTDARGTITGYAYDALNRLTSKTYSVVSPTAATPNVTYLYDSSGTYSKGRLTSISSSASVTSYNEYDALGRVKRHTQTTAGQAYALSYSYDLAGNLRSQIYPSARVVLTDYDRAGRISEVTGRKTGESNKYYTRAYGYGAQGAVQQVQIGNGLWEHSNFNSRLQATEIGLGTSSTDSSKLRLDYVYGTSNNNGNLLSQTINAPGVSLPQSYAYDALNRLQTATESGGSNPWTQSYGYDPYGNRWVTAGAEVGGYPTWVPQSQSEFNAVTNRLVSPSLYDAAGNLTMDKVGRTLTYDAENRQVEFNPNVGGVIPTQYFYDGGGRRVKKEQVGVSTTLYVYNIQGQLIAEYVTLAPSGSGTSYLTSDHLGNTRLVTDQAQQVKTRHDYLPFGEEVSLVNVNYGGRVSVPGYTSTLLDGPNQKFTAKERDTESNLDYLLARYHSGAQGRLTSHDPENAGAYEDDPQTWNGYSYVRNNPLLFTDPTGEAIRICGKNYQNCVNSEFSLHYFERTNPNLLFSDSVINAVNEDGSLTQVGTYTEFGDSVGPIVDLTQLFRLYQSSAQALFRVSRLAIKADLPTFVYRGLNDLGKVVYVGITNNLARRRAQHLLAKRGFDIDSVFKELSREDARAVEQALIEIYKLEKKGGTLENVINSIALANPKYADAVKRGFELLKGMGYEGR